jgi:hypothetical protein
VSLDILSITSPVDVSMSKKEISCRSIVSRYSPRIRAACLSPVIIQQDTSARTKSYEIVTDEQEEIWICKVYMKRISRWLSSQLFEKYSKKMDADIRIHYYMAHMWLCPSEI